MQIKASNIRLQFTEDGKTEYILTTNERHDIADLKTHVAKGKYLAAEVKPWREKRSLDSNAYFWLLLSKMADVLHIAKDELYLIILERYGVFTHIIVKPNIVEMVKREWRTVRELGEVTVNGKTGIQLQCFFGSSTYDTKQMSTLIEGVVDECKELMIETLPPDEISRLNAEWGK